MEGRIDRWVDVYPFYLKQISVKEEVEEEKEEEDVFSRAIRSATQKTKVRKARRASAQRVSSEI